MTVLRLRLFTLLLVLGAGAVAPAAPVRQGHVAVELVPAVAAIVPGQPFTVALRLQHDPGWHTYWINPGTGYATSLAWALPPGFSASEIRWPTPHLVKDKSGTVTGYGYEGDDYLLVTITPPATLPLGGSVTLQAKADWLMCETVCIPGEAELALTLPVAAGPAAPHPQWGARLAAAEKLLPQPPEGWQLAATRAGQTLRLFVRPAADPAHRPQGLYFFSSDGQVDFAQPQHAVEEGGGWVLTFALSPAGPQDAPRLVGDLVATSGFRVDGTVRSLAVDVPFGAAPAAGGTAMAGGGAAAANLPVTLLLAFAGGLILILMPCVFPVLGVKILGFVNQAGAARGKVRLHGLAFTAGVLVSFWLLSGLLLVLRAGGQELGWGFQLQSSGFVFFMALLLLVFALNLGGLFEFGLSATGVGSGLAAQGGFSGSFFSGVLATLVATPCSAPFLAPALGAALQLDAVSSVVTFTAIALGLAAPYLLLSFFPAAVKLLPRPGAWMESFKQFMAFPLYATVGYLVWVLAGQMEEQALLLALLALVVVALGLWVYGRFAHFGASGGRLWAARVTALALLAGGAALGVPRAPADSDPVWARWSPEAVRAAVAAGRPVYVDFTARWCATCLTNKAAVFSSGELRRTFREQQVLLLKADWTNRDPQITAELAKWNRSAIPFNLIYVPGRAEPVVLPELLTAGIVLDAFRAAAGPAAAAR